MGQSQHISARDKNINDYQYTDQFVYIHIKFINI